MRAVAQWNALESELGDTWERATLAFAVDDPEVVAAAAGVLGPIGAGRVGTELRFQVQRREAGPEKLRNLLGHLDRKRFWGELRLLDADREVAAEPIAPGQPQGRAALATQWEAEVARLPAGWRDLLCELELDSTDYLAGAALLGSPLNPSRAGDAIALRFRVSRDGGYGAAAPMARRCLERMDEERITGRVRILTALSDTENVATQGPVWRVAGRAV